MNYLEELRWLVEERWEESAEDVEGRERDVPLPEVIVDRDEQRQSLDKKEYIVIEERTGGELQYFLSQHRQNLFRASILVRAASRRWNGDYIDGQTRVYGEFDETERSHECYGGMTGEIERIIELEMDGGPNFDVIRPAEGWQRVDSAFGVWAARLPVNLRITEKTSRV